MTEWSKAFRVIATILLIITFIVIGLVFASKSDLSFHVGGAFNITVEPTPPLYIDPIMRLILP